MSEIILENPIQEMTMNQIIEMGGTQTTQTTQTVSDGSSTPTTPAGTSPNYQTPISWDDRTLHSPTIIGGVIRDTEIDVRETDGTNIFHIVRNGDDRGDVIIGNYTGNKGALWDKSVGTFNVKGVITATSGTIGGFTITSTSLYGGIIKTAATVGVGTTGVIMDTDGLRGYDSVLGLTFELPTDGGAPTFSSGVINETVFEISTNSVLRTSSTVGDGTAASAGILINNTGLYGCQASQTLANANIKVLVDGTVIVKGSISASTIDIGTNGFHCDIDGNIWWGDFATYALSTTKISSAGVINFASGTFGSLNYTAGENVTIRDLLCFGHQGTETGINITEDSYIYGDANYHDTNYGSSAVMKIGLDETDDLWESLVWFNVSTLIDHDDVTSVKLKFRVSDVTNISAGNGITVGVKRITATWNEDTVTYHNKPGASDFYAGEVLVESTGWKEIDITDIYKEWKKGTYTNYGVYLTVKSSGVVATPAYMQINTKENAYSSNWEYLYTTGRVDVDNVYLADTTYWENSVLAGFAGATITAGNSVQVHRMGSMSGFTLTKGKPYYADNAAGGISDAITAGGRVGIALTSSILEIQIATGIQEYIEIVPSAWSTTAANSVWEEWDLSSFIPLGAKSADITIRCATTETVGVRQQFATDVLARYIEGGAADNPTSIHFTVRLGKRNIVERYSDSKANTKFTVVGYWT